MESKYFLGRVNEDEGNFEEAILNYSKVLKENPRSVWAQKANRRLYVLGKFYSKNEKLADVAKKNSKYFGDSALIKDLEVYEKIEEAKPETPEIEPVTEKKSTSQDSLVKTENISDSLAMPDSLARLGDKPELADTVVNQAELEKVNKILEILEDIKIPEKLVEKVGEQEWVSVLEHEIGDTLETQKIAKKEKEIISDPIRTKEIFSVIQARSNELQYTYEKWRKKGDITHGKITLKLIITPDGTVRDVIIENSDAGVKSGVFSNEILAKVKRWKFRQKRTAKEDVAISFPITFISRDARRAGPR